MFVNDLFNKKKIIESLRDGEYYTYTVTFNDGTTDTINVASDEFDFGSYYAKRGKKVTDVARQGGIQGSQSDTPGKPHDYPNDRGMARAQKAYDRQVPEQRVAEGISVVDQDYDLDQIILTLNIEGKKVSFTYTDYEEDFANAERKDVFDQLQKQPWYARLDHFTRMEILDAAYRAIRGLEPQEYRPTVGDEPLDEQGVAEGFDDLDRFMKAKYGPKPSGGGGIKRGTYGQPGRARGRKKGELSGAFHQGGGSDIPHNVGFDRSHSERSAGRRMPRFSDDYDSIKRSEVDEDFDDKSPHSTYVQSIRTLTNKDGKDRLSDRTASLSTDRSGNQRVRAIDGDKITIDTNIPKGVNVKMVPQQGDADIDEGSVQDKLHKRHQELRKKRGAPDPEYYKELKKTYDMPDDERWARTAELKKKYKIKESTITNEDRDRYLEEMQRAGYEIVTEAATLCPECGGAAYADRILAEKQDACYHKVKSRYKVWPSAYASGALVRCRKKGAKNWGNKRK
jgi:hypothetical protein